MNILLVLVPISLLLLGVAIAAFIWAVRAGQFDDLDTPSIDILAEEDPLMRSGEGSDADSEPDAD